MCLGLLLPAMLLGYLAGGLGLVLGAGWLTSLGLVAGVGTATALLLAVTVAWRVPAPRRAAPLLPRPTGP